MNNLHQESAIAMNHAFSLSQPPARPPYQSRSKSFSRSVLQLFLFYEIFLNHTFKLRNQTLKTIFAIYIERRTHFAHTQTNMSMEIVCFATIIVL